MILTLPFALFGVVLYHYIITNPTIQSSIIFIILNAGLLLMTTFGRYISISSEGRTFVHNDIYVLLTLCCHCLLFVFNGSRIVHLLYPKKFNSIVVFTMTFYITYLAMSIFGYDVFNIFGLCMIKLFRIIILF
jgi:hypothetical protein